MAKNTLANPIFSVEEAARLWFEAARWPNGPVCPHCKSKKHYSTKKLGRYRCGASTCRKDYTVMTGTVMERSHAKLTQWAAAFHLGASSKKGFSARQLHRELGCQYNTAWFLHHRVMEAMRRGGLDLPPLGGEGEVVEADETYHGPQENPAMSPQRRGLPYRSKKGKGPAGKRAIFALVQRGGNVRTFHVPVADQATVQNIIKENIARESRLHTDESRLYFGINKHLTHETVKHSMGEYVRDDVHTNTVEVIFQSSSAGCAACTSIAKKSICIGTWLSLISGTTPAKSAIWSARLQRCAVVRASA